jgi:hypothetical protein
MSIQDLLRYAQFHLGDGSIALEGDTGELSWLLSRESVERMRTARVAKHGTDEQVDAYPHTCPRARRAWRQHIYIYCTARPVRAYHIPLVVAMCCAWLCVALRAVLVLIPSLQPRKICQWPLDCHCSSGVSSQF